MGNVHLPRWGSCTQFSYVNLYVSLFLHETYPLMFTNHYLFHLSLLPRTLSCLVVVLPLVSDCSSCLFPFEDHRSVVHLPYLFLLTKGNRIYKILLCWVNEICKLFQTVCVFLDLLTRLFNFLLVSTLFFCRYNLLCTQSLFFVVFESCPL